MEQNYHKESQEIIDHAPRSRLQDCAYVILSRPSDAGAGVLLNISMGGLMFEYITMKAPSIEATELEILMPNGEFRLGGIPCQGIWDKATAQVSTTSLHKRQCGVQFGQLTQSQIVQLEYFVQNYAMGRV